MDHTPPPRGQSSPLAEAERRHQGLGRASEAKVLPLPPPGSKEVTTCSPSQRCWRPGGPRGSPRSPGEPTFPTSARGDAGCSFPGAASRDQGDLGRPTGPERHVGAGATSWCRGHTARPSRPQIWAPGQLVKPAQSLAGKHTLILFLSSELESAWQLYL